MNPSRSASSRGAVSLAGLEVGRVATITKIVAEDEIGRRLLGLGIRPGKRVRKVSAMFLGGPITVQLVGGGAVALGRDLADRVFAEAEP